MPKFRFDKRARDELAGKIPADARGRFVERVEGAVAEYLLDRLITSKVPRATEVRAACDELADHALWLSKRVRWADAATRAGITTALLYHVRTPVSDPGAFLDRLRHDLAVFHEAASGAKLRLSKGSGGRPVEVPRRHLVRRVAAAWRDLVGAPATTGAFPACLRVVLGGGRCSLGRAASSGYSPDREAGDPGFAAPDSLRGIIAQEIRGVIDVDPSGAGRPLSAASG
jgi:hypothetical protein